MAFRTSPPTALNNRLDFLKDTPRHQPRNNEWRTVQRRDRPSRPQNKVMELPTHSVSRQLPELKKNDRLAFLDEPKVSNNKKTTFVAMTSEKQWNDGYRPAWILRSNAPPPEKYQDALKIYKNYIKTGEIVFPQFKVVEDKVKSHARTFHSQNSKRK